MKPPRMSPPRSYILPEYGSRGPTCHWFLSCPVARRTFHLDDVSRDPCFDLPEDQQPDHVLWSSVRYELWKTRPGWVEQDVLSEVDAMLSAERQGLVRWQPLHQPGPVVVDVRARRQVASVLARVAIRHLLVTRGGDSTG